MKLLSGVVAAALLAAGAAQAQVEDWRLVVTNAQAMNSIDASGIKADGTRRVFDVLNMKTVEGPENWAYSVTRWEMDCEARLVRVLSGAAYTLEAVELDRFDEPTDLQPMLETPTADAWRKAVCEDRWPDRTGRPSIADEVAALRARRLAQ